MGRDDKARRAGADSSIVINTLICVSMMAEKGWMGSSGRVVSFACTHAGSCPDE